MIICEIKDFPGIIVGGQNINNLRYADDAAIILSSQAGLQNILNKLVSESKSRALSINIKKTECMVVSRKSQLPECRLRIGSESIKKVDKFKYLGSWIMSYGKCDQDIRIRISLVQETFQRILCIVIFIPF